MAFFVILSTLVGLLLLWKGADFIISGAQEIARNFDISPIVIAITIIAFGTSLPELVVSLFASVEGNSGISLGNIIGSNIANIGLVLGIAGLFITLSSDQHVVRKEMPFVVAAPIFLFALGFDGNLTRMDGIILLTVSVVFHILLIQHIRKGKFRRTIEDIAEDVIGRKKIWKRHILKLFIGLFCVVFGAQLAINGSVAIAASLGVSHIVIGITLVAIGTSLPELVTSVYAAVKKDGEISLGNIIGSNILNVFFILGLTVIIHPIQIEKSILVFDLPVMLVFSLLLYIILLEYGELKRKQAYFFLFMYFTYIGYVFIK